MKIIVEKWKCISYTLTVIISFYYYFILYVNLYCRYVAKVYLYNKWLNTRLVALSANKKKRRATVTVNKSYMHIF